MKLIFYYITEWYKIEYGQETGWKTSFKSKQRKKIKSTEKERALKGAYESFVIPGTLKADIDSYHIKAL